MLPTTNTTNKFDLKETVTENRFQGLWRLMQGYRLHYASATLSLGLTALLRTGTFLLLRYLVDEVLPGKQVTVLPWIAAGFVGLALLQGGFTFLSGRLAAQTAEGIAQRLRDFLFDHIQRLPFTYHDQVQTGELIQRCTSDVEALRRFFADQALAVGRISFLFVVNLAALLLLNWQLALASIVVVPVVVLMSVLFFKRVTQAYEAYQDQEAVLSTTLQENLSGVRVVKAFARQAHEKKKFEKENRTKFELGKRLLLMHSLYWPLSDILCGLQMVGGFFVAALMAINGQITVGTYLAYAGLVIWIIWPMRNLGRLIVHMSMGLVSYERIAQVIREDQEPLTMGHHTPSEGVQGEVVFRNVSFGYEPEEPVLQNINLRCNPGEAVGLLGATGSGKSTLANLLPRFYEYEVGSIQLDGVELTAYPRRFLRQQIGIVEQEPLLFSRTIRENVTYGVEGHVTDEAVEAATRAAAIHDVILSFPQGYDTLVGEKGVTLSGGQKQRLAIARTLLKDPSILILDDATSSVDVGTESEIRAALQRLMKGRTTFIIAHRVQSVMNADLILVLENGRIVQRGQHQALMAQPGAYRQIYEMQTQIEADLAQELEPEREVEQEKELTDVRVF